MRKLLFLMICSPLLAYAQGEKGINFEQASSWQQVLAKAKAEKKFIFVDFYATWCGPCKEMDKKVYPNEEVGNLLNRQFIAIKVQQDKTIKDNDFVKSWYKDAEDLSKAYKVDVLPTYLFFSPDGGLAHRASSFQDVPIFLETAKVALINPIGKYESRLQSYQQEAKNYADARELIKYVNDIKKDEQLALQMATDYKKNYLDKLSGQELLKKEYLDFIGDFYILINSKDKFFKLCYEQPDTVNKVKGWARTDLSWANWQVQQAILREEINAKIWKDESRHIPVTQYPDWEKIETTITRKYGKKYATALLPNAKMNFYKMGGNCQEFARIIEKRIQKNPPQSIANGDNLFDENGTWALNSNSWSVFQHCTDKKALERALEWVELAIKTELDADNSAGTLQYLDTRANLLYKLGKVNEAIAEEQKALELARTLDKKAGQQEGYFVKEFTAKLNKMKKGEPTWPAK